ncbi:MAG: MarR family transcriptional regulator [Rhodospirillaceae bacterium]|nr:MarR family transcriptional regulator [Rhodospirillaceae bacterium]
MSPDDDGYIGYVLSDVARLIRTVFDRRVRSLGLTRAQWLVLSRLYRRPGASQTELADMLEVDRASAGRMIDRMEKGHWVERRGDAGDRRVKRLYLTQEARRVHARMWAIAERTVDDALAPLSPLERARFTGLAARVKERLQSMAGADSAGTTEAPAPRPAPRPSPRSSRAAAS